MAKKKTQNYRQIILPSIPKKKMLVRVCGDGLLVTHKFSDKAKQQMLDKQTKAAKTGKQAKNPQEQFEGSLYYMNGKDGKDGYGIRAVSFKKAAVSACRYIDGLAMTVARGSFFVSGSPPEGLLPILDATTGQLAKTTMRDDFVRLATGVADIRFRGQFLNWMVELPIEYNASCITDEQILNMINHAGFHGGVGENRPEKTGDDWGRFHVETAMEPDESQAA